MKSRSGRRFCLGFQWDAQSWENAASWTDPLFSLLGSQRVHWILSAVAPGAQTKKRAALAKALRSRIEAKGDLICAAGFAGACHPLLNLDELDRELAWGLKNQWQTGVTDVLDLRPSILVPRMADLARPEAWKLYEKHGFALVGTRGSPGAPLVPAGGCFSVLRLRIAVGESAEPLLKQLRRLVQQGDLFLVLDVSGLQSAAPLQTVLGELVNRETFSLITDGEHATIASSKAPGARSMDWSSLALPAVRGCIEAASGLARKKKKKIEEYSELLSALSREEVAQPAEIAPPSESPNRMRLVAHMLGDVALAGREFDVQLSAGRFCGITQRGSDLLPRVGALSYLRVDHRTTHFKTRSSFSFEGEEGTGLREELAFAGQDGAKLSVEYSFYDDSPLLSIVVDISYPRLPGSATVDEYAPLGLVLRELARGESVEVQARAPDESVSSATLLGSGAWVALPGAEHTVKLGKGRILMRFAPREARRWGIPFFRTVKGRGGRRFLEVNPFGSYAPLCASALSGRREKYTLLLGVEEN